MTTVPKKTTQCGKHKGWVTHPVDEECPECVKVYQKKHTAIFKKLTKKRELEKLCLNQYDAALEHIAKEHNCTADELRFGALWIHKLPGPVEVSLYCCNRTGEFWILVLGKNSWVAFKRHSEGETK